MNLFARNILAFLVVFNAISFHAAAGPSKINTPLRHLLTMVPSYSMIQALVLMDQRPDPEYLNRLVIGYPRHERASIVWSELLRLSDNTQEGLISFLVEEQGRGRVASYKQLRICNGVIIKATSSVIRTIATRDDVCRILNDAERTHPVEPFDPFLGEISEVDELDDIGWKVELVDADVVWADGYTGDQVLVAVIDTGVDYNHQNLMDHLWNGGDEFPNHGYNFHDDNDDPMDNNGHGTNCANYMAGDGTVGDTVGIAPDAIIMILKVREDLSIGVVTSTWLAQDFVLEHGVDFTQMSLGWGQPAEGDRPIWRSNYDILNAAGIVNIKSAGNRRQTHQPPDAISVPGDVPSPWRGPYEVEDGTRSSLIAVGATNSSDVVTSISSPGPVTWMDIEPYFDYPLDTLIHVGLIKPDLTGPSSSATSVAAPVVSGVVALMLSKDPELLPVQIDSILETTALDLGDPGKDNDYGAGRVRALEAVDAIWMPTGFISGTVFDMNTGNALESAIVYMLERPRRQDSTAIDGAYQFEVQTGEHTVMVKSPPNPVYNAATVTIIEGEEITLDITYPSGIFAVDPDSLEVAITLEDNPETTRLLNFDNGGTLPYDLQLDLTPDVVDSVDFLEEYSSINLDGPADNLFLFGLTSAWGIHYVSGWDEFTGSGMIYKFLPDGEYLGSFPQPAPPDSLYGMQDMAFDGMNIWGGIGSTLYSIDRETETLSEQVESPYNYNSALSWDSYRHLLWVAHADSNILAVDPSDGTVVDTIENNLVITGMAYYGEEASGYPLLLAVHDGNDTRELYQANPVSGDIQYLASLPAFSGGGLGGLAIERGIDKYFDVIASLLIRNDFLNLSTWKLKCSLGGVSLDRNSLTVDVGEQEIVQVDFNIAGLASDVYRGYITATYTAGQGSTDIPISFTVDGGNFPHQQPDILLPDECALATPYPNPFNSVSIIGFTIPQDDHLTIVVYDILGREVAVLLDSKYPGGYHRIQFDGSDLASGVYFILLTGRDYKLARKMVLIK